MASPVWKWKRWKIFRTKVASKAAIGPVWLPQALETLCLILFWGWKNSLFSLLALWPPQYQGEKGGKFSEQKWLNRLQMVQFDCPRHWKPSVSFSSGVGRIPSSHYWPSTAWCEKFFPLFEIPASFLRSKMASPCTANWPWWNMCH